ncbi:Ig-like domain-containing protein [Flectobacillus roseus]
MRKLFGASNVFTECLSYLGNILINRIFAFVSFQFAFVFFVSPVLGQNCTDLFLLNSYDGKVYSISALDGSKTLVTTMTTGKSNLAVGPDATNLSSRVFVSSQTTSGSTVFKNNSSTGITLPLGLGGLTTNPLTTGANAGYVYGMTSDRHLVKVYPSPSADLGVVTGDATWTGGSISNDAFFDNTGKMYVPVKNGSASYLYSVNLSTKVASQVIQLSGSIPSNFQGIAFFNDKIYATELTTSGLILTTTVYAKIYEINPNTGQGTVKTSIQLASFLGSAPNINLDLATCDVFVPTTAPSCNELFGVVAGTHSIYRIDLSTLATTLVAEGNQTNQGNMAFGPIPGNLNQNRFVTSVNNASGTIYTAPAQTTTATLSSTGNTIASPIGLGTDPASGVVYGIASKALTKWTGTGNGTSVGTITGDATWVSGTTLNDIAVDASGNLYCILMENSAAHLYRINPTTLVATKVVTASGAFPTMGNGPSGGQAVGNGLAYLGDFFYYSRINGSDTDLWRINASTGVSTYVGLISGLNFGDLGSCATVTNVPATFSFNCSAPSAGLVGAPLYANGTTGQTSTLRVPISNAVNGQASLTVTVSGAGIVSTPSPFTTSIAQGETFVDIPITYDGSGATGTRTLTINSPNATGTCSITIAVSSDDADGDGVTDGQEGLDGTDPMDACSFVLASQTRTPSSSWNTSDCDGDGISNSTEKTNGTNPLDPCDPALAVPVISSSSLLNVCPATTVNLNSAVTGAIPSGSTLVWFTNNAHTGTAYATPTAATNGTYYAFHYNATTGCYSAASNSVDVFVSSCSGTGATGGPCNTKSPWTNSLYTNLSASRSTGGLCLPIISGNNSNLVDADLTNNVSFNLTGLGCNITIAVKDNDAADTYPAGYYAGFKIGSANLISGSIASGVRVETYNNGAFVEGKDVVTSLIGIESSLLDGSGLATVGFVTTAAFDEIRIKYTTLVGALFSGQVYYPVIEKFCAPTALTCNTQTILSNTTYSVVINDANTGISGLACVGCSINNSENLITSSTSDFATITMAAALGSTSSISVKDVLTTYTAGSFAGFNIANTSLINANLLSGITIKTYKAGVLQETSTTGTLLSVNSSLLTGSGNQLVGFVTTKDFDEVQFQITNLLGIISTTNVYNLVVQKLCAGPALTCDDTYIVSPTYPAVLNGSLTGISGAACVACAVNNTANVLDASTSNYADIILTAGILSSGSISVKDAVTTYPAGTFAGYDVENSSLLGASLFNNATITTYLNGVAQESNAGGLISLTLLSSTRQVIGFKTTKPFNEVRISIANLVGVNVGTTRVYGVVLRTATTAGFTAPTLSGGGSASAISNICPATTANLNSAVTSTTPIGSTLVWFTNSAHTGTALSTPGTAGAGTYYAFYYDATANCYSPASGAVTVTINVCDSDGDGDLDSTDPAPNDPCVWSVNQVLANTTTAWRNADCDGDGVKNYDEAIGPDGNPATIADNTDPRNACSLNLSQVTLVATSTGDCDGDGVTNKDEINGLDRNPATTADNTNPLDLCSYNVADQVFANTNTDWKNADCDKDGNPNGTDPNPKVPTASSDMLTAPFGVPSTVNVLTNDDFLPGLSTSITKTGGTAIGTHSFDAVTGLLTYSPAPTEPGTNVTIIYQVCNTAATPNVCATATVTISVPAAGDLDGDGDPDNTDPAPTDGCVWGPNQVLASTTTAWRNSDCDGDGVTNYKEVTGTDNNLATTADNTNPLDGCSYNAVDQVLSSTSAAWKLLDCDKDGNPNGTDPNPKTPTAVADAFTAKYGSATGFNILANDDFLPGLSTSLSKTGGTSNGTVSFNALTGVLTYTPTLAERGTTVTVTYQVCNTAATPNVCASATVTITVPVDTDADGVPDVDDLDDDNDGILDTVENAQLSADTDGDGIPNRLDLDSDNDGINDVNEANGIDIDGDGMADGLVSPTGIPSTAGLGLTPPDTDNDLKPDPYDLDSNNDGISDLEEGGLNPSLDANGDGIVDCTTNCDPDGDGILTPVDGLPNVWKDALLPDLTPTTDINSLEFLTPGTPRDFVVNVFEINDKPNLAGSTIGFRVAKISGFTITYPSTSGTSNVFGGTANSNSDWTFTENANFIIVTAKPGVVIPQNGQKTIGFTVARKSGVPSNTSQNITVTIIYGSAGEEKVNNNTVETKITAN